MLRNGTGMRDDVFVVAADALHAANAHGGALLFREVRIPPVFAHRGEVHIVRATHELAEVELGRALQLPQLRRGRLLRRGNHNLHPCALPARQRYDVQKPYLVAYRGELPRLPRVALHTEPLRRTHAEKTLLPYLPVGRALRGDLARIRQNHHLRH
jgi:hypothetical protein